MGTNTINSPNQKLEFRVGEHISGKKYSAHAYINNLLAADYDCYMNLGNGTARLYLKNPLRGFVWNDLPGKLLISITLLKRENPKKPDPVESSAIPAVKPQTRTNPQTLLENQLKIEV